MAKPASGERPKLADRTLDARRDTVDFRDRMYVPTLVEVPSHRPLADYKRVFGRSTDHILDQGREGACTGFGLACMANYLLRSRKVVPSGERVSPRMLYEMARRYDEWPGERYSGSSARGAMKGWHKHGVCSAEAWPYRADDAGALDDARARDARRRPLGAYFRVDPKDLVAMHAAIAEVGVLFVTAQVHQGWDEVGPDGVIPLSDKIIGGHAFALVAYDEGGFWLQNSWGPRWGREGFAHLSYDDWLANGDDVWVARLGVGVELKREAARVRAGAGVTRETHAFADLRPHIISVGNDGKPRPGGAYGTRAEDIRTIIGKDLRGRLAGMKAKRVLLYAHGGLVDEDGAIQRVADYRKPLLEAGVYPLSFIWKTDAWTTITNILKDSMRRRRPEGVLDAAKDFMLDRIDDTLEPIVRRFGGKSLWDEMKENALLATEDAEGAARLAVDELAKLAADTKGLEVHVVGHSAGSIFMAPLIERWIAAGRTVASCTMWAPACTIDLFRRYYLPGLKSGAIKRFALFTLDDAMEQDDDTGGIYNKSLLYLVARALETAARDPKSEHGTPLLGMQRFIDEPRHKDVRDAVKGHWVLAPNREPAESMRGSTARRHGDFDDDKPTLKSTLAFILDGGNKRAAAKAAKADLEFRPGAAWRRELRRRLQ